MAVLPLTCLAVNRHLQFVRIFACWVRAEVGRWAFGCGDQGLDWSGRGGSGPQTAAKQVHPLAFAMPSFGQVKRDVAAAVPGEGSVTSVRSRRM